MDRTDSNSAPLSATDHDAYRTLGINPDASTDDIRSAYRKRAHETHPDRRPGADAGEFIAVQSAYERLTKRLGNPTREALAETVSATTRVDTITVKGVK